MIKARHAKILKTKKPVAANNTLRIFRALYNYAAAETADANGVSILPANPVSGMSMKKKWAIETRRSNIVDEAELKDWWA